MNNHLGFIDSFLKLASFLKLIPYSLLSPNSQPIRLFLQMYYYVSIAFAAQPHLDPDHHVEVPLTVLLHHVLHVVWFPHLEDWHHRTGQEGGQDRREDRREDRTGRNSCDEGGEDRREDSTGQEGG